MGFPTKDTVFGTIFYKDNKYDLLTNPLSEKKYQKLNKYKKENNCGMSTASWNVNNFEWIIDNNKLYLIDIKLKLCKNQDNLINEIFKTSKLFANWLNDDIKLLISKKEIEPSKSSKVKMQRDIFVLNFNNGLLIDSNKITEQYQSFNLKYYIEKA
jgi:hypothetical protein